MNFCCICHDEKSYDIVFSDGLSGGEIKIYCLGCFYKEALVGFRKISSKCKCGQNILLLNGETFEIFKNQLPSGQIEYVCESKLNNLDEKGYKDNLHTYLKLPICREKSKIEQRMVDCYIEFKRNREKLVELKNNLTSTNDETFYMHQRETFRSLLELEILNGIVESKIKVGDEIIEIIRENPAELENIEEMGLIIASALGKALRNF